MHSSFKIPYLELQLTLRYTCQIIDLPMHFISSLLGFLSSIKLYNLSISLSSVHDYTSKETRTSFRVEIIKIYVFNTSRLPWTLKEIPKNTRNEEKLKESKQNDKSLRRQAMSFDSLKSVKETKKKNKNSSLFFKANNKKENNNTEQNVKQRNFFLL